MRHEVFFWFALTFLLFAAEALAPGAFMLWFGFAAAVVALLVLLVPGVAVLWQAGLFVLLAFVSVQIYRRWFRNLGRTSTHPLLNRRAEQLVGQIYPLDTAIVDGRGRLKIGDAYWAVEGPDLPSGTPVRIHSVNGMSLRVQAAD